LGPGTLHSILGWRFGVPEEEVEEEEEKEKELHLS
jgi:hypothetical protein